jgi:general secretion pathway protein J
MIHTRKKSDNGFTLLELLISLTIFGLIVGVIFNSFRIGIRAWEKGEEEVDRQQRCRIALDLIRHQLASIHIVESKKNGQGTLLFRGTEKSVEFISPTKAVPGNQRGLVYVHYVVKPKQGDREESLLFSEKETVFMDRERSLADLPGDTAFELITGVQAIEFGYLSKKPDQMRLEWEKTWDLERDKQYPMAVKLTVTEKSGASPIVLVVRLEAAGFHWKANEG